MASVRQAILLTLFSALLLMPACSKTYTVSPQVPPPSAWTSTPTDTTVPIVPDTPISTSTETPLPTNTHTESLTTTHTPTETDTPALPSTPTYSAAVSLTAMPVTGPYAALCPPGGAVTFGWIIQADSGTPQNVQVDVNAALGAGVSYLGNLDGPTGTISGNHILWNIGDIAPGPVTLRYVIDFRACYYNPSYYTFYSNGINVSGENFPQIISNVNITFLWPTNTRTVSRTPTQTATPTLTPTPVDTDTPTQIIVLTNTPTSTSTETPTPTDIATEIFTDTQTHTNTDTPAPTSTQTYSAAVSLIPIPIPGPRMCPPGGSVTFGWIINVLSGIPQNVLVDVNANLGPYIGYLNTLIGPTGTVAGTHIFWNLGDLTSSPVTLQYVIDFTSCMYPSTPYSNSITVGGDNFAPEDSTNGTGFIYPTMTRTNTLTRTPIPIQTSSLTVTLTRTHTNSITPTPSFTFTRTPTFTMTRTNTFTQTWTPTNTFTRTNTNTATVTYTSTNTPTGTWLTSTPTWTRTHSLTFTPTPTYTWTHTATLTPTQTLTYTHTPTHTLTMTLTTIPTYTPGPTLCSNPFLFGFTGPANSSLTWNNKYFYLSASPVTLGEPATIIGITVEIMNPQEGIGVGLYDSAKNLVVSGAQPSVSGTNAIAVPQTVLSPGVYWITTLTRRDSQLRVYNHAGFADQMMLRTGDLPYGPMPSLLTGYGTYYSERLVGYANYCRDESLPTITPTPTATVTPTRSLTFTPTASFTATPTPTGTWLTSTPTPTRTFTVTLTIT